jgi:ABC-type transport system involved in multi-copper enzyme maturation permease subunit
MYARSSGIKTGWNNFWSGLRNGLAPMLGKEMRSRTRGWRSPALLTLYLGLLSGGTVAFLWLNLEKSSQIFPQVGLSFYGILVFGLVLLLAFIAPAVSASAISGERERRTYDLLLVTRASLTGIVLGKWLASVAYLLFLVLAALPLLALVYLFGGVPLSSMLMAVLICMLTGLGYGALGLCLSALLRRSQAATIVSLVLVFLLIFGTLVVAGISAGGNPYEGPRPYPGEPGFQPPGVPWYVYMSPLSALTDALPGTGDITPGGGIPLISSVMNELMRQIQPGYMGEYAMKMGYSLVYAGPGAGTEEKPAGMAAWPFWARFALNQAVLALAALVIAVVAIAPRKPWHRGRALNK